MLSSWHSNEVGMLSELGEIEDLVAISLESMPSRIAFHFVNCQ